MQLGMQIAYAALADGNSTSKLFLGSVFVVSRAEKKNRDAEGGDTNGKWDSHENNRIAQPDQDGFVGIVSRREIRTRTETQQLGQDVLRLQRRKLRAVGIQRWGTNRRSYSISTTTIYGTRDLFFSSFLFFFFSNSRMDKERQAGEAAGFSCSWLIVTVVAGRRARGYLPRVHQRWDGGERSRVCQSDSKR